MPVETGDQSYDLQPIGWVESPIVERSAAPKQGDEGSPDVWLSFDARFSEGIRDLRVGDDVIVLTWLHRARRDVQVVRPRNNPANRLFGVFSTRSPDRPNPIGLHRVQILDIQGTGFRSATSRRSTKLRLSTSSRCSIRIGSVEGLGEFKMKKAALATIVFVCSVLTHAQPRITGMWQAEVQPGIFWTIELKADGSRLTGTAHDRVDAVDFYDGTISGNSIAFKVTTLFGEPTIIFTGVVTEDQIAFSREIQGQGNPRFAAGILSPVGVRQFTLTRVPDGVPVKRMRGAPFPQQLTVYDRRGKIVHRFAEPDTYNWPEFSPDGKRLGVAHRGHLWVFDLAGERRTRVTSPPWLTFAPAWSADGRQLTYFSWHERSAGGVYRRASDGTGIEEKLYESQGGASVVIRDLSVDERWLSFDSGNVMFTLPLTGERKAIQLAPGGFRMRRARFSPDNRFLAYESDETGQFEVFVQAFDPTSGSFMPSGRKWQISKDGGGMAHWRRDGRELIYLGADGVVRGVDVSTTPVFRAGTPRVLFQAPDTLPPLAQCFCVGEKSLGAVSRDGQRVAFVVPLAPQRKEITVAPEILLKYTGTYQLFGFEVKIALEENRLVATGLDSIAGGLVVRERVRLVPQSETSYFFKESSGEIDFGNDENGKVAYFLLYEGFGPPTKAPRK